MCLQKKTIKSNLLTCYVYDIYNKTMKKTNHNVNRKEKLTKHWFQCDNLHLGMYLWFFRKVLSLFFKIASDEAVLLSVLNRFQTITP